MKQYYVVCIVMVSCRAQAHNHVHTPSFYITKNHSLEFHYMYYVGPVEVPLTFALSRITITYREWRIK